MIRSTRQLRAVALLLAIGAGRAVAAPNERCFDLRQLSTAEASAARAILGEFADHEGLYTLGGGLKPISSASRSIAVRVRPVADRQAFDTLDLWRRLEATLICDDLGVHVQRYAAVRSASPDSVQYIATLVLVHRGSLRRELSRHATFWETLGLTPSASPAEVLATVEYAERAARWRGYGYLFGYPEEAVDFFVRAGIEGDATRSLVPRDFRDIETFRKFSPHGGDPATRSHFVYAVAKGAPDSPGDLALRRAAAPIFAEYLALRTRLPAEPIDAILRSWPRLRSATVPSPP